MTGVMSNQTLTLLDRGTWHIDDSRSTVGFLIRHLGVATVRGRFSSFGGRIDVTESGISAAAVVRVASVDTGNLIRDQRLRSEFFDAERFPAMAFVVDRAVPMRNGGWVLRGDISIRGVTRPVELRATAEPLDDETVRVRADGKILRTEFGLDWAALRKGPRPLVGDRVRLTADAALSRSA
jgi:polyisoprenoid-binding protein YceI